MCALERIRLDLGDVQARRRIFGELGRESGKTVCITEGLLIYLTPEAAAALAQDLAGVSAFQSWILDVASPGLLRVLKKRISSELGQAAPFKFAPEEGPKLFERFGWKVVEVHSLLKNAARLKRLSLFLRLIAMLPETERSRRDRPWSGVCLLSKG